MALISKISKLNRIPQLLNQKRRVEEEEQQRKKREDSSDRPPFPFYKKITTKKPQTLRDSYTEPVDPQTARARRQGIGRRIDVFA